MRFSCEGFLGYKEEKGVGDCLKPKERIFVQIAWFLVTLLPVYLTNFFIFFTTIFLITSIDLTKVFSMVKKDRAIKIINR